MVRRTAVGAAILALAALLLGCGRGGGDPRLSEARQALDAGNPGRAQLLLQEAIARKDSGEARDLLGLSLRALGKDEEAEHEFREAVRIAPGRPEGWDHLAALCYQKGRTEEAIRSWTEAVNRSSTYAPARYNLGSVLMAAGRNEEAASRFREALKIDPGLIVARINLGVALVALGRASEAEKELEEAARRAPSDPEVAYNLGAAYAANRKTSQAIKELKRALQLRPDFPEAMERLATATFYDGKQDEALKDFREALRLRPDFPDAHFGLGVLLTEQGKEDEAIREYEKVLELEPEHPGATTNLTLLYARTRAPLPKAINRAAAFELFRRAIVRNDAKAAWDLLSPRSRQLYLNDPERFRYAFERGFSDPKAKERSQSPGFFLKYLEPPRPDPASGLPYDPTRMRGVRDPSSGEWKVDFWVVEALPAPENYP